jgi:hypothetical protein
MDFVLPALFLATFGGALGYAVHGFWRAADALAAERESAARRARESDEAWSAVADLAQATVTAADFREAGWSEGRIRSFLDEHFPGRESLRLAEIRPFLDDVLVRDVLSYRRLRLDSANRYEAIRHTWVNVDALEREKRLPPELRPLVREIERQSGRLIRAGDLLPFVGRPVVRELLEKRLAECGAAPTLH